MQGLLTSTFMSGDGDKWFSASFAMIFAAFLVVFLTTDEQLKVGS
jgi:hypothetical protein